MECLCIWRLVEIEVASEYLVSTLAREYHLNTHRLYDACQEVHRGRGADCGHIVGLDKINNIAYGIETFLNCVVNFMVNSSNVICHHLCLCEVRCTFQTYGKRVESRPPGLSSGIVLNTML